MALSDFAALIDIEFDGTSPFYTWGWWLVVAGAGVAAVALILSRQGPRTPDQETESMVATLNLEAAQARERAAQLEIRVKELENERELLNIELAWRELPANLATVLEQHGGPPSEVNIIHAAGDPEAHNLAIQLANIFDSAKWCSILSSVAYTDTVLFGLWVPDSAALRETARIRKFLEARIPFSTSILPRMPRFSGTKMPNAAVIFVGSKGRIKNISQKNAEQGQAV